VGETKKYRTLLEKLKSQRADKHVDVVHLNKGLLCQSGRPRFAEDCEPLEMLFLIRLPSTSGHLVVDCEPMLVVETPPRSPICIRVTHKVEVTHEVEEVEVKYEVKATYEAEQVRGYHWL
jgi:hypothetical protein